MTLTNDSDVYYDPYDAEIDADPYPVWRRMRDEAPVYHHPELDFYATSPEALAPLQAQLEAFAPELPPGVTTSINELAPLRAEALAAEAAGD